jgi:peptidoglycan/xylan/chitin deacetylase (PgdA/CDA1 family)
MDAISQMGSDITEFVRPNYLRSSTFICGQKLSGRSTYVFTLLILASQMGSAMAASPANKVERDSEGAIIRGDVKLKKLALVFTGGDHAESTGPILDALKQRNIRAGFFVTGDFVRRPELQLLLKRIVSEGHYLGPHSDSHPLYCDWKDRQKTLVTHEFFTTDLKQNLAALRTLGALPSGAPVYFIPPYEWYNREQVAWAREMGVTLINFTPGSGSNRDYAPERDRAFVPSQKIYDDILSYERKDPHGLNGFVLLLHLGSGRKDPFHTRLGSLCDELIRRGYQFERIDLLCGQ